MKAISLAPFNHSFPDDDTVFNLRPLNGIEDLERNNLLYGHEGKTNEAFLFVVKKCLTGWSKYLDANDKEIVFNPDKPDENMKVLHADVICDLYKRIIEASEVSDQQKKT